MQNNQIAARLEQIAVHLSKLTGNPWKTFARDEAGEHIYIGMGEDRNAPHIYVEPYNYPKSMLGKLNVRGSLPFEYNQFYSSYDECKPSDINVSATKSDEQIATTIYNRLLGDYLPYFELIKKRYEDNCKFENERHEKLTKLAAVIGEDAPEKGRDRFGKYRQNGGYASEIRVGHKINLKLDNLTMEQASFILDYIYNK